MGENVQIWSVKLGRRCAPPFLEHSKKPKLLHDRSAVICASLPSLTILLIDVHVSLLGQAKCMWPNLRILFDTKLFRSAHETRDSTTFHSVSASPSRFWCCLSPPETLNTLFDTLEATGITIIDATQLHQGCESLLGNAHVFLNDLSMPTTKPPRGFIPGSLSNHPRLRSGFFTTRLTTLGISQSSAFCIPWT